MSVEALQNIFQRMEDRVRTMIQRGSSDKALGMCLTRAWNENFKRDISEPAVRGMIMHYRTVYALPKSGKKMTRKMKRSQSGGMAPLEWTLGQGISAPIYGRFSMDYTTSPQVLDSLNRGFESPAGRVCNSLGGHDAPGQGQGGGGFFDAMFMPHAPASVPRNALEGVVSHGMIANPASSPVTYSVQPHVPTLKAYEPTSLSQLSTLPSVYKGY